MENDRASILTLGSVSRLLGVSMYVFLYDPNVSREFATS